MKVVINCDDIAMHPYFDDTAVELFDQGIVKSFSIMATGMSFDDAVTKLLSVGVNQVGVHLSLIGEREFPLLPVLSAGQVRSLVDHSGQLHNELPRSPRETYDLGEFRAEMVAQIAKVEATGLRVTHLDGHRFFYEENSCGMAFYQIVRDLAHELGVPFRSLSFREDRKVARHEFIWDLAMTFAQRSAFYTEVLSRAQLARENIEILIHPLWTNDQTVTSSAQLRHDDFIYFRDLAANRPIGTEDLEFCDWSAFQ